MMKRKPIKHHIDGLMVLLLFGVFAACLLSVLLMGADAYQKVTARDEASYSRRTAIQYICTRVRQADCREGVSVGSFDGLDALVMEQELGGSVYCTRIYCSGGYLRELFAAADAELLPEDGEKILPAEELRLSCTGNTITAELLTDGAWQTVNLLLRSGEGAAA